MTRDQKREAIRAFETAYSLVDEEIEGIGKDELLFVPPIPEAWSINDFLAHFLDADISMAFRARLAVAESGSAVPLWDENAWHDVLHYDDHDGLDCLAQAKALRGFVASGLRPILDDDWSLYYVEHPVKGKLDLAAILSLYESHVVFHLPLIRRNRKAWKA